MFEKQCCFDRNPFCDTIRLGYFVQGRFYFVSISMEYSGIYVNFQYLLKTLCIYKQYDNIYLIIHIKKSIVFKISQNIIISRKYVLYKMTVDAFFRLLLYRKVNILITKRYDCMYHLYLVFKTIALTDIYFVTPLGLFILVVDRFWFCKYLQGTFRNVC